VCRRTVRKFVDVAVFIAGMKLHLVHALRSAVSTNKTLVMAALCNRGALYFCPMVSSFLLLFSSPNLSRRILDVYHTSTHGVALVRI